MARTSDSRRSAGRPSPVLPVTPNPASIYDAKEETLAGYAQLNFQFGDRFEATAGLRAVRTKVGVAGTATVNGVLTPIDAEQEFTDYLPNASLRFRFTPELQFRLSATQTRTRPTFEQLNPSVNVGAPEPNGTGGTIRRGSGGNPFLQPINSDNYDASLEYYFSRTGFAAIAAFHRDVSGFIQEQRVTRQDPVLGLIDVRSPVNSRSGDITGFEAQVSTFFDFGFVPNFLRNFGIQANYTYIDAEVDIENPLARGTFFRDLILTPAIPTMASQSTPTIWSVFTKGAPSRRGSPTTSGATIWSAATSAAMRRAASIASSPTRPAGSISRQLHDQRQCDHLLRCNQPDGRALPG
jgi:TonB-dependent receptor